MKSEKSRLVVRRSNKYLITQLVNYDEAGDKIVAQFNSISLKKKGWKHSCANVPAAYLSGLEIAKMAKTAKIVINWIRILVPKDYFLFWIEVKSCGCWPKYSPL